MPEITPLIPTNIRDAAMRKSSLHNGHYANKPQNVKRSVIIAGQRKSISLEEAVWQSLKEIADYQDMTLPALVATIDSERNQGKLS